MNSKATAAALTLAIPMAAMAQASVEEKQTKIEQALESALSRQGISVGGLSTGEYASSKISGSGVNDDYRSTEPVAYTQVDFDIKARPNTSTTARAVFRMHLDWPNFWGSPSTPIETRWLSIDGKAMDMLYYSVGSMGAKWTPLTMWAPEVGFLYTPRLFAQQQQQAMNERFLGDNKRILPGAQFGIRASMPSISLDSFNVGLLGSKLYSADHSTAEALKAAYPFTWGSFDRVLYGLNGDATFAKGLNVGLTALVEEDLKSTYKNQSATTAAEKARDSAQAGSIFGVRLGAQLDRFVAMPGIKAGLELEYVSSTWDKHRLGGDTIPKLTGGALSAAVKFGYEMPKTFTGKVNAGFMTNDSAFRNDVAQSATFNGGRIYNTEQLAGYSGWGNYNLFDAMYHNVYRFVPEASTNNTAKNAIEKNNYTNQVFDPSKRGMDAYDMNVQMVLPNGLATANRTGLNLGLEGSLLEGAVDAQINVLSLSQVKGSFHNVSLVDDGAGNMIPVMDAATQKATYQKIQAGTKVRVDKFLTGTWDLPLEFSASYEQNTGKAGSVFDYASTIMNVGAYIAVHKRLALLAGYQSLNGDDKTVGDFGDNKQTNTGAGLEVKIQEGAYLLGMWNKLTTKFPTATDADYDQSITSVKLQVAF